jgi:acyl-CoA thioester hydrolase
MSKSKHLTLPLFLKRYAVVARLPVQWGEQDSFSHVNNTVYFKYMEAARIQYFARMLDSVVSMQPETGPAFKQGWLAATAVGPILTHTECSFKFPLTYPDRLLVGATVDIKKYIANTDDTGSSSSSTQMTLKHEVWSLRHNRVVASGTGSFVTLDYGAGKVTAIPEFVVQAVKALELGGAGSTELLGVLERDREAALRVGSQGEGFV